MGEHGDDADGRRRRIGVFGGTFDPPHLGHIVAAEALRAQLELDLILFVVANDPWQKSADRSVTPARLRLEMTRLAVVGHPGLEVSDVEIRRGGPSYTVDTLRELRSAHPGDVLVLLVGADAAAGIETWEQADHLAELAELVVVDRPGGPVELPDGWPFVRVHVHALDVSSSEIRRRATAGEPLDGLVPEAVVSFIREHGIYREAFA